MELKTAITSREVKTTVGGGSIQYPVTVPKGTLCKHLGTHWSVQDLSWLRKEETAKMAISLKIPKKDINPMYSIVYHDAYYRGITIDEKDLEDFK